MQGYGFDTMEREHDYIQWMFPTAERSMFNPLAPMLTSEQQAAFKHSPVLQQALRLNFEHFCSFLGLEVKRIASEEVRVVVGTHFTERVSVCWDSTFGGNHNWLRISRVLQSLGLCSLPCEQRAFMACLNNIYEQELAECASAIPHWRVHANAVPSLGD